jgi:hypothetical protein
MTEEARGSTPPTKDLGGLLQSLLPGLAWTSSTLDRAGRIQAAAAVESLRRLNLPLEQTLARHHEFEAALADAAKRVADLATQLDHMARTYAQLNRGLEASVEPYLRYVDQLDRYASGWPGRPD